MHIMDQLNGVNKLNKILYSKNISLKRKIQIFESSVLTILLNTAETKVYNVWSIKLEKSYVW